MAGTSLHDAIEYEVPELAEGEPVPRPPAGSPPELKIRWEAPMPIVASRADLDLPHHPDATERGGACQHRLVTIGDSISQGFKSLAISETSLSWPAMVAHELGLDETGFTYPTFPGPDEAPGLPLNLEALFRTLESASGGRSLRTHEIKAAEAIADVARSVAAYWERLDGAVPLPPAASFHHNLAVTGYDVRDSIGKTSSWLEQAMTPEALRTHFVQRVAKDILRRIGNEFSTSYAEERIALRTLNGPDQDTTQVSAAKWLGDHGGIETLVVALGANNALGVVLSLQLHWTGPGYDDLAQKDAYNLWAPDHFEHEYALLVNQLRDIDAKHVILATVPHVTIVPITRGVGDKPYYSRYFARYTRPWISDANFDPSVHPCITGDEARAVDAAIDQYNYFIKRAVRDARLGQGAHADDPRDWYLFDLCGVLDRLAYRRYLTSPQTQPGWFAPYELPAAMRSLSPWPDTRFFETDVKGRTQGGLIALDGVHPSTTGYTIIAQQVIDIMSGKAGVQFADRPGGRGAGVTLDLDHWMGLDSLITNPPKLINEIAGGLYAVNNVIDLAELLVGKGPS